MNAKLNLIAMAVSLVAAGTHADELADKGRDIFNKNEHAVVTVQAVLKVTYSSGPRSGNASESKQELTGTVIDPSGLTVLALSSVDPAEFYKRVSEEVKVESQVNDLKILLDDGTEIPADIVLRDQDLDLVFIRPKSKLPTPMAALDLTKSAPVTMLEPIIALNRLNRASGRAYAASVERIQAVIQKPRTFYIPGSSSSSASLGSPAFAMNGNIVGIFVMRAVKGGDTTSGNMRENMTAILVPAADVLKAAKQAPEVKADAAKPAEKPAATPETKAPNTAK